MIVFVIIIWSASGLVIYHLGDNWGDRGTMGDMFGAVNALFSGLAFAALLFTIFQQREEIRMNRIALEQNRHELMKSVIAQQNSQEALKEQSTQMHLTAKLNAMNTMITYYNSRIADVNSSADLINNAKLKRRMIIRQIDDMMDDLNDIDIE